jgi:hypothetical protein
MLILFTNGQGCSNIKGTLETRLHIFFADRLTLFKPGGADYALLLGASSHFFGHCYSPDGVQNVYVWVSRYMVKNCKKHVYVICEGSLI